MPRPLAVVVAASIASYAAAARAEPFDLDLSRLGAPRAGVWTALAARQQTPFPLQAADAERLANEAKARFAILSSEMALAISSAVLQPASTTGHSGFDVSLESAFVAVHPETVGTGVAGFFDATGPWTTRSRQPHDLFLPSVHVRKALPFSFELGGRMIYLAQSSYFAGQLEAKWALNEGFTRLPDIAVRAAWTELFGQRDWNLGTGDLDLMVSKRWGVNAVTSFTPYLAARFTFVNASTDPIYFTPPDAQTVHATPQERVETTARFPTFRTAHYRTTAGVRMTAYLVSLAIEATYFGGSTVGTRNAADSEYPRVDVESSFSGAARFGFEF